MYTLSVRCTRCGAQEHLVSWTAADLQHDPPPYPPIPKAKAWIAHHQALVHGPNDPTRHEIDRWLLGYRDKPDPPYDLVSEITADT
jgi:hypothetical protein